MHWVPCCPDVAWAQQGGTASASCWAASAVAVAAHSPSGPAAGAGPAPGREDKQLVSYPSLGVRGEGCSSTKTYCSPRAPGASSLCHIPAALAAGAQLEKSFSGSATTAVAAAAVAEEADRPTKYGRERTMAS